MTEGDGKAFNKLARAYLEWFENRACRRHGEFKRPDLQLALRRLAAACDSAARDHPRRRWLDVCSKLGYSDREANRLYSEALSSGLTVEVSEVLWRWRHPFVMSFLQAGELEREA